MKLFNLRLGLATNSSSTHSLIFLPGKKVEDKDVDQDVSERRFGWSRWTAASPEAKRAYVACMLLHNLPRQVLPFEIQKMVVQQWTGQTLTDDGYGGAEEHIDHQSVYCLPRSWDGKFVDKEFFDEFSAFMLQKDLVILGGNDNEDDRHALDNGKAFTLPLRQDDSSAPWVARKDPKQGYWTLFNRAEGTKIRFTFDDLQAVPRKASVPELVDVKITDYCPVGCKFCYQDSTASGKHADKMGDLTYAIGKMKVFEVAIGGGEPTLHPDFVKILSGFRAYGVVPNFTTKLLHWLRDPKIWTKVIEAVGAFAYSVDDGEDVDELAALLTHNGIPKEKASVQYVMGSNYALEPVLEAAGRHRLRVTLLGYKTTGRGKDVKPTDYNGWITVARRVQQRFYLTLGIDTALAAEYEAQLEKEGVPKLLFTTQEGKFSMYVDAVEMKCGPSSYCDPGLMRPIVKAEFRNPQPSLDQQLLSAFRMF